MVQVLTDPKISREVLLRRAKGLKKLGAIFQVGPQGGCTLVQAQLSGVNEANGFPHFAEIRYTTATPLCLAQRPEFESVPPSPFSQVASAYHSACYQTLSGSVDVNGYESRGRSCLFCIAMPTVKNDVNIGDHHYHNNHNQLQFSYNYFRWS